MTAMPETQFNRHDLLWLNAEGRNECLATARPLLADATREAVEGLILNPRIPAIVSRQEERRSDRLDAGFSSPEKHEGSRLRVAVAVNPANIAKKSTPFDAADAIRRMPDFPRRALLAALLDAAERNGFAAGFFGSVALGAMTGLPYFGEGSDIDLCVQPAPGASAAPDARGLYRAMTALEEENNLRIDIEVAVKAAGGESFGVNLKELIAGGKTVLAKGLHSVELLPRPELEYAARGKNTLENIR